VITTGAPIYLRFDTFATEANYDYVNVYDGSEVVIPMQHDTCKQHDSLCRQQWPVQHTIDDQFGCLPVHVAGPRREEQRKYAEPRKNGRHASCVQAEKNKLNLINLILIKLMQFQEPTSDVTGATLVRVALQHAHLPRTRSPGFPPTSGRRLRTAPPCQPQDGDGAVNGSPMNTRDACSQLRARVGFCAPIACEASVISAAPKP
jgi:hypothetical protein